MREWVGDGEVWPFLMREWVGDVEVWTYLMRGWGYGRCGLTIRGDGCRWGGMALPYKEMVGDGKVSPYNKGMGGYGAVRHYLIRG